MFVFLVIIVFLILSLLSPLIVGIILLCTKYVKTGGIIIGISVLLLATFVIHAQLNKRSTSGHILRHFEGEDGAHQDVHDLAEDTKKSVDPIQLQNWAVNVLQGPSPTNSDYDEIPVETAPASVQHLEPFPIEDITDDAESHSPQNGSVWITWGGPFGHWGMRIGSPAFKVNPVNDDNYYMEWQPGIYFWCETH